MAKTRGAEHTGGRLALAGVLSAALALAISWSGCSPGARYQTLSFFFDGVPDPSAPVIDTSSVGALRQSPTYSVHKPFAEERCSDCHRQRFKLGPQDSGLCLDCHAEVPAEHPVMHGPVAAVACLWCHSAHESAYPALLKGSPRQVCSSCHEPGLLSVARVPAHADPSRSCLDCHQGHGGEGRHFLRPGAATTAGGIPPERAR